MNTINLFLKVFLTISLSTISFAAEQKDSAAPNQQGYLSFLALTKPSNKAVQEEEDPRRIASRLETINSLITTFFNSLNNDPILLAQIAEATNSIRLKSTRLVKATQKKLSEPAAVAATAVAGAALAANAVSSNNLKSSFIKIIAMTATTTLPAFAYSVWGNRQTSLDLLKDSSRLIKLNQSLPQSIRKDIHTMIKNANAETNKGSLSYGNPFTLLLNYLHNNQTNKAITVSIYEGNLPFLNNFTDKELMDNNNQRAIKDIIEYDLKNKNYLDFLDKKNNTPTPQKWSTWLKNKVGL